MELTGVVAVVTGASSGMGLAAAKTLLSDGAQVVALARNEENLNKTINSVPSHLKPNIQGFPVDVRKEASVRHAVEQTLARYGKIDILINAAGVSMPGGQSVQDIDLAEWNRIMETNLTGTFLLCKEVLPGMVKRNSGYIINILSTAAFHVSGGNSLYAASKFGARALTEALIAAHRRSGIRVSSVSPGAVDTNIWSFKATPVTQESKDTMLKATDIAEIIRFLVTRPPDVHIENITVTPWRR